VRGICDLGYVPQSGTAGWQRGALDRYEGRNNPLLESHSTEQLGKSCESLIASCPDGRVAIAEALTETHESVICTFVCDGIIEFTSLWVTIGELNGDGKWPQLPLSPM
jgi:16S rRNA C1402 (ribose-2'-O) methylase RsmI